jgi:hypothetical protein
MTYLKTTFFILEDQFFKYLNTKADVRNKPFKI